MAKTHKMDPAAQALLAGYNGEPELRTLCGQVLDVDARMGHTFPATTREAWRRPTCAICLRIAEKRQMLEPVPMVERRNLLNGQTFTEAADTPYGCSPADEAYWSN